MIKRNLFYIICLLFLAGCKAGKEVYMFTSFREPADEGLRLLYSEDAYHWKELNGIFLKPQVGGKLMRDPSMVQGPDGTYHLVWTTAWRGDNGFGYASTKDLVNWSEQQFIPVMKREKDVVNVWAPELFYDDERKEFVIVWASTIPFRFPKGVEEENNNHRLYYVTTKDFKTFSDAKLFYDPGFSSIDAVIVKDKKDKYIQVVKDNTRPNRNLKVAFANDPLGPYQDISQPFTGSFIEGPTVVKKGDEWLIYFDVYQEKIYGAMKTKDFKTFTDITKEISVPDGHKHGTIFKAKKKLVERIEKEN
jgi:hypothetical protein